MATARGQLQEAATYDSDFYSWALRQAALLRERRFDLLDVENLAEEVEDLARRHADALQSRYETLIQHLLKWEFQPQERSYSWMGTIRRERGKIAQLLKKFPGLKPLSLELFRDAFDAARVEAAIDADLPIEHFPEVCPYTPEQAMDPEFWPGGRDMPVRDGRRRRGTR